MKIRAALHEAREAYRRHAGAEQDDGAGRDAGGREVAVRDPHDPVPVPSRPDQPDVVLDIPRVHVDEIDLKLDELKARVALEAHVLDLLRLDVGVDAELRGVQLDIKGVDAEAQLRVRLENLTVILDRVMDTIDANPQILENLADRLGQVGSRAASAVGELGRGVGELGAGLNGRPDAEIAGSSNQAG